jgi:hypothetical protein
MNKTETKPCSICGGGTMYHNKGISKKTGKPYENWKCSACKEVEWVDDRESKPAFVKEYASKGITAPEMEHLLGIVRGDIKEVKDIVSNIENNLITRQIDPKIE